MAYNRVVLDGDLGGGVERWSVGINYAGAGEIGTDDPVALTGWAEAIYDLFDAGLTGYGVVMNLIGNSSALSAVRTYYYPTEGGPATAQGGFAGTRITGTAEVRQAPQVCQVVSLLTGLAGRRTRGRFYWPALACLIGSDLKHVSPGSTQDIANAWATVLEGIGEAGPVTGLRPVVVSKVGAGDVTKVTSVQVRDVYDTQRRRRDALIEARATATL